jgi:hypothetical protein
MLKTTTYNLWKTLHKLFNFDNMRQEQVQTMKIRYIVDKKS